MTQLEVSYHYGTVPSETSLRALDAIREIYGVRRLTLDERARIVRVEFDASRLKEPIIVGLLRRAGIDLQEGSVPA
jgi:hypothetical protein